ncbi:MAG: response regulator transcription factor [Thermoanaerobaculia bacterium]
MTARVILVVEDDLSIRRGMADALRYAGYEVREAGDGVTACELAAAGGLDLVLLDLVLPRRDGLEVLRRIRREDPALPAIVVTARGAEEERVRGLELGADDYVVKPFSPVEVVARVKAVMRRVQAPPDPHRTLRAGPVELEPASRRAVIDGDEIELTRLEFDLLAELAAHPRVVYTRERLLEKVWGYQSAVGGKTVDVHVANLRRKLGDDIGIVAVRGVGYKLEPAA